MGDRQDKIKKLLKSNKDQIRNSDKIIKHRLETDSVPFFDVDILGNVITNRKYDQYDQYDIPNELFIFKEVNDIKTLYNNRLRNVLLIKEGEIPFNSIGSDIYDNLYTNDLKIIEPNIKSQIREKIRQYHRTDVIIQDIRLEKREIDYNDDHNRVIIDIMIDYEIPYVGNNFLKFSIEQMDLNF